MMKIFLSYSESDQEVASAVSRQLSDAGYQVWDDRRILPGDNWLTKSGEALEKADALVLLVTPRMAGSRRVNHELEYALGSSRLRHRVVSVFDKPVRKLPFVLKKLPAVNLTPDRERFLRDIDMALRPKVRRRAEVR